MWSTKFVERIANVILNKVWDRSLIIDRKFSKAIKFLPKNVQATSTQLAMFNLHMKRNF